MDEILDIRNLQKIKDMAGLSPYEDIMVVLTSRDISIAEIARRMNLTHERALAIYNNAITKMWKVANRCGPAEPEKPHASSRRQLVYMLSQQGYTYGDIARRLGINRNTAWLDATKYKKVYNIKPKKETPGANRREAYRLWKNGHTIHAIAGRIGVSPASAQVYISQEKKEVKNNETSRVD